jgi:SusD/RagB-like outer membrane lipoprotein
MKKITYLFLTLGLIFSSCSDITDLNVNPKLPEAVPASSLFANATVDMFDFMSSPNVNVNNFRLWSQQWAQVSYSDESNYELVERNVNGRAWNSFYSGILRDLKEARLVVEKDVNTPAAIITNQKAIIDVMEVVAYTHLVDIFGDVPFSAAFGEDVTPGYDDDEAIYTAMIGQLDNAIGNLSGNAGNIGDLVYGGDAGAWKKFANSYKLRLAIRIADGSDSKAKEMVEAAYSGAFDSSADNFVIQYESSTPNTNPLWEDLVQSGRSDFVAANTLVDYMNALDDPRRQFFFKQNAVDGNGDVIYQGGIAGAVNSFTANSQVGAILHEPTMPGTIMGYSEVRFLLADAAERGYSVGGTAEEHYNAGITESILEWGGDQAMVDAYLANPDVAYSTAPGTWKEKIALQKYIALYNQGFEAWSTYRVYDAPVMNEAEAAGTTPPHRYTYPVSEYSINEESVMAGGSAMGGDDLFSKVFWDKN